MVNSVLREHAMFRWELVSTQTIVSKESHLESGGFLDAVLGNGDVIYSVWSEERFATVDLKRDKSIPNLEQIKKLENEYSHIVAQLQEIGCSPLDNYATPYEQKANWPLLGCLFVLWIFPGILYKQHINKENKRVRALHLELRPKLLEFIEANKHILNI
jgi:hypothetical protein